MQWRRRKSLVSPKEQIWFGLELVTVAIGFNLLCFFFLFMSPLSSLFGETSEDVFKSFLFVVYSKWPLVMLSMLVLLFIGVLMSHRLYGPLFGVQTVIRGWRSGNTSGRLRIRKFDYLISLMQPMNAFLDQEEAIHQKAEALVQEVLKEPQSSVTKTLAEDLYKMLRPHA